jgi:hypothetical protein
MLYRLCEHYNIDSQIYKSQFDNDCFICFEYKNDDGILPINLKDQELYLNQCICNGSVHNQCLKIWIYKNKSCPICRIKIIEANKMTIFIYTYMPCVINVYIYIKKISTYVLRIITFLLFLYVLIDLYLAIINTRYRQYYDYTHTSIPVIEYEDVE